MGTLSDYSPTNRHHFMHASMVVALLMALAGGSRLAIASVTCQDLFSSHILLTTLGTAFLFAGIKSFRHARLSREVNDETEDRHNVLCKQEGL